MLCCSVHLLDNLHLSVVCRLRSVRVLRRPLRDLLHDHADGDRHRPLLRHHATSDLDRRVVTETGPLHPLGSLGLLSGMEPAAVLRLE